MIHSDKKHYVVFGTLALLIVLLVVAKLFLGSVNIPAQEVLRILSGEEAEKASWTFIVWESRFPQCITALLCGAALSASGLMLQTVFSNPLADSSILGISSGASLGVALVMLAGGGTIATGVFTLSGFFSVILGAFLGAVAVLALVLFLSSLIKSNVMLLIAGIMIGYITSSLISLLNFFATAEGVHSYMVWGMGNFGGVSLEQLPAFSPLQSSPAHSEQSWPSSRLPFSPCLWLRFPCPWGSLLPGRQKGKFLQFPEQGTYGRSL